MHFAVEGVEPRLLASPESAEEAAQLLVWASAQGIAIGTRGGGTRGGLGNIPRAYDLALTTEKLSKVLEYEPADLTITVGAGTPFAELQRTLRERGQFLPLDPAAAEGSTIGGVIATNASGPFRLRYGSARDLLIGSQVATTAGTVARAGGKVVKNVTGYDLNKLYIGSLGTLGVMTELTFKVQPVPESERTLAIRFPDAASAYAAVYRTLRSPLTPSALELDGTTLYAHLGGFAKPLERSVADLTLFAREAGASAVDAADAAIWDRLRAGPAGATRLKLSLPVSQQVWALSALPAGASAQASIGSGIIRVAGEIDLPTIRRLRAQVHEHLGTLVVEACSIAVKRELDVFGEVPDNFEVMRRLKMQLDPAGVLNPGRFLGRL